MGTTRPIQRCEASQSPKTVGLQSEIQPEHREEEGFPERFNTRAWCATVYSDSSYLTAFKVSSSIQPALQPVWPPLPVSKVPSFSFSAVGSQLSHPGPFPITPSDNVSYTGTFRSPHQHSLKDAYLHIPLCSETQRKTPRTNYTSTTPSTTLIRSFTYEPHYVTFKLHAIYSTMSASIIDVSVTSARQLVELIATLQFSGEIWF